MILKQLILKEVREQFKVALIAAAVLSLMLALGLVSYGNQLQQVARNMAQVGADMLQPLLNKTLLSQVSCFCGLFGALLGWLQIRAEAHPDLWAFLVHRPVPRTTLFWNKAAAGLMLYGAAVGLPLAGFVLFVAVPGKVAAPFAWAMALPLLAILLAGTASYFAGVLTGLRRARWYASRGLGLGVAVLAHALLFVVPEFWHAVLLILFALLLLACASWGSFQTGGFFRDQPAAAKGSLALGFTLSAGVLMAVLLALTFNLLFTHDYTYSYSQLSQFEVPGALASARTAYRVDLEKQELTPLFSVTNGNAIIGFSETTRVVGATNSTTLLVLSRTAIDVLEEDGRFQLQSPYLPAAPEYPTVSLYWLRDRGFALRFDPDNALNQELKGKLLSQLRWLDPSGGIRSSLELPTPEPPVRDLLAEHVITALAPLAIPVTIGEEANRLWNLPRLAVALLCAGAGWRLGSRHHFSRKRQLSWGAYHFLFGVPGFLAFLAVQEWPAQAKCPGCGRLRVVDLEQCEHCEAGFAPPAKTGTEIFEPLTAG